MRLLKEIFNGTERAWVYCANKELQIKFLEQAEREGFSASPKSTPLHHVYGIGSDLHVGCLSTFLWYLSFQGAKVPFPRIDYQAFLEGKDDYECREPHVRQIG